MSPSEPLDPIAEQLFCTAFNAGERYALELDSPARLNRLVADREEFEAIYRAIVMPPAPGEVTLVLSHETAQRLIHILEPVQDAALRDATYDMDAWLACQDVMTQIDGQTHLTFSVAPGER